jgi:hypothetical protein
MPNREGLLLWNKMNRKHAGGDDTIPDYETAPHTI